MHNLTGFPHGEAHSEPVSLQGHYVLQETVDHHTEVDSSLLGDQVNSEQVRLRSHVYVDSQPLLHQLLVLLKSKTIHRSKKSEWEDLNSMEMKEIFHTLSLKTAHSIS